MMSSTLRALAAALLLGTGIAAGTAIVAPTTAEAAKVRAAVGNALNAAIHDAQSGSGNAALEKIHEAESVPNLTSDERQAIEQTKNFVAAKTGAGGGAVGCKAKFANDYSAGHYSAVVGDDADCLRKAGAFGGEDELIVAQAYYLMHDYDQCVRVVRGMGHAGGSAPDLMYRCAYETHDEQTTQGVLETLITEYNEPKYWSDILDSATRMSGLSNADTLDVYRLRAATGTMKPGDYETATEVAIQLGSPAEGVMFAQKGMDAKALTPDRGNRLLSLAKAQAASDAANWAKLQAAANASKTGEASMKLGEELYGMGKYQDALTAFKAGVAKGTANPDEAQIRIAMAYIGLHQRDEAVQALKSVSKTAPAHTQTIARLWSIYARTH